MSQSVSNTQLAQLSGFIAAEMGLHFPRERWRDLQRGIGSVAREFGFRDADACIQWLLTSPLTKNQIEVLASHLTIGETYFFRGKKTFEILQGQVLAELIRSRREAEKRLRIWSAGCATGEEPYSIAILLRKMIPDPDDWSITILATDINPRFLQKAADGVYTEWSFRNTSPGIKEGYFRKTREDRFELLPHIKKLVGFSYLNLAEDSYPSLLNNTNAMDLILCRNVLMYFAPERAKTVIHNLYRSLVVGGWLIVSPSEASHVLFSQFETVNFPDAIFYRKGLRNAERGTMNDELKIDSSDVQHSAFSIQHSDVRCQLSVVKDEGQPTKTEPRTTDHGPQTNSAIRNPQFDSSEPATPYMEALTLYEQGRYAEVTDRLTAFLSRDPETPEAMSLLVRAYANQGHLKEALQWSEKAITADKLNPELHYLRAMILQEQGAIDEAMWSLKRALYLEPNFALAHFALGNLALRLGRVRESDKHFENALMVLRGYQQEDILPQSEGLTAGRLLALIHSTISRRNGKGESADVR